MFSQGPQFAALVLKISEDLKTVSIDGQDKVAKSQREVLDVVKSTLDNPRVRTDLALKSSGGDARVLLERLIVELCGEGSRRPWRPPGARVEGSR